MKIWLDDDPKRDSWVDNTWTIVRTAPECIDLLLRNPGDVELLSLDHDLGDDPDVGSGYEVVALLESMVGIFSQVEILPEVFEIHSGNPVGRKNMQAAIDSIERMRNVGE